MFKFASLLAVLTLVASGLKHNPGAKPVDTPFRHNPKTHHEKLWDTAEIKASQVFRIDKSIGLYLDNKKRYKTYRT